MSTHEALTRCPHSASPEGSGGNKWCPSPPPSHRPPVHHGVLTTSPSILFSPPHCDYHPIPSPGQWHHHPNPCSPIAPLQLPSRLSNQQGHSHTLSEAGEEKTCPKSCQGPERMSLPGSGSVMAASGRAGSPHSPGLPPQGVMSPLPSQHPHARAALAIPLWLPSFSLQLRPLL